MLNKKILILLETELSRDSEKKLNYILNKFLEQKEKKDEKNNYSYNGGSDL